MMADESVFVKQFLHTLRKKVRARVMTEFPTTLRPLLHPVRSCTRKLHAFTTGKYTVKEPCNLSQWSTIKLKVEISNMELATNSWNSGYNKNIEGCVFTNIRTLMYFLDIETNFYRDVLGRVMADRDGNDCYVIFGTCPIGYDNSYNVTIFVGRSWNGNHGGSVIEENFIHDASTTPTLQVKQKYELIVGSAIRQNWSLDDVRMEKKQDKLAHDRFSFI